MLYLCRNVCICLVSLSPFCSSCSQPMNSRLLVMADACVIHCVFGRWSVNVSFACVVNVVRHVNLLT